MKWDSSAFCPTWKTDEGKIRAHTPTIIVPPQDGTSTDFELIFQAAEAMRERWPSCAFCLDPEAGGEVLAQRIDRELGGQIFTHSQRVAPMCRASQGLAEVIASGEFEHPDDHEFNRHVLGAAARFVGVGWRFTKQKGQSARPIDAVIATAIAVRVLLTSPENTASDQSEARGPSSTVAYT